MKYLIAGLLALTALSALANENLVTCSRKWKDSPAYDRGIQINRCISIHARKSSFKSCLLAARFIDNEAMSFDYKNAAINCLKVKGVRTEYQCDLLNGESDSSDKYNEYYIDDCHYALEDMNRGF